MTETPEGSPAGDPQDVLTALRERIASDSGNERREALQSFAKAFLRRLSDEDLLAAGPDTLFGMVSSAFRVRRFQRHQRIGGAGVQPHDRA